jgi:hypothetical protein
MISFLWGKAIDYGDTSLRLLCGTEPQTQPVPNNDVI